MFPTAPHLRGDQLEGQLAVSLHARGAGAWFQLEPAIFASYWHLLRKEFRLAISRATPSLSHRYCEARERTKTSTSR